MVSGGVYTPSSSPPSSKSFSGTPEEPSPSVMAIVGTCVFGDNVVEEDGSPRSLNGRRGVRVNDGIVRGFR